MLKHFKYLWYVLRHKWFVFVAGINIGLSFWQSLTHDLSKFSFSEWSPYAERFYGKNKDPQKTKQDFDRAWLHHQRKNKHHWQYWLLYKDNGGVIPLEMPERYVKEMVADWVGAGRAITGKVDVLDWYNENKIKMNLHKNTKELVEKILYKHYKVED